MVLVDQAEDVLDELDIALPLFDNQRSRRSLSSAPILMQ